MKKTYRGKKITNSKILARFIAHELRNSELENLHAEWLEFTDEEIADAFIFLAKNDAMTGQVIYVDAGFTLK